MSEVPDRPLIYHITHIDNLRSIIKEGGLWSDSKMIQRGGPNQAIGMSKIKERRLKLPVPCQHGTFVGQYVPFYFCPRSVMLYLIDRGNHPELHYRGGQKPIIHLEASLYDVVDWVDRNKGKWAFSLSNAGAGYTVFRNRLEDLHQVNWNAVAALDWRDPDIKEGKQAEFLVYDFFPWHLVERIGVISEVVRAQVVRVLAMANHTPPVVVQPNWYY